MNGKICRRNLAGAAASAREKKGIRKPEGPNGGSHNQKGRKPEDGVGERASSGEKRRLKKTK